MVVVQLDSLPKPTDRIEAAIDMSLTPSLAAKLTSIKMALVDEGATIGDGGKLVATSEDALKCLISKAAIAS